MMAEISSHFPIPQLTILLSTFWVLLVTCDSSSTLYSFCYLQLLVRCVPPKGVLTLITAVSMNRGEWAASPSKLHYKGKVQFPFKIFGPTSETVLTFLFKFSCESIRQTSK